MNRLYPMFMKICGQPVLVVGGGNVGEQKIRSLLECSARVTVISPTVTPWIEARSISSEVLLERREYAAGDAAGYVLVIAATNDLAAQKQIYSDATSLNIPVNVADEPELCTFYLGSVFQKGNLKVAVSTNGLSPTMGKIIRDRIAREFGIKYPELIDSAGRLRSGIREAFPDYETRKMVQEQYVASELQRIEKYDETGDEHQEVKVGNRIPENEEFKIEARVSGKVFLVGAGPGDPELISVKGLRILRSADVVLYDALVCDALLSEASHDAEVLYVGKRAGYSCMKQEEINGILIRKAREGKRVVRLKCGDPFVFGRGGEESDVLQRAGIEVEIVPGITAGTGVPASIGIPLTHRKNASSVLFVTGHEAPLKGQERVDWASAAHADTIVIYMGTRNLHHISEQLTSHGVPDFKPAAVIFGGTTDNEKVVTGTLGNISDRASEIETDLPGLIVIGETVKFLSTGIVRHTSTPQGISAQERISYVEQLFV